MKFTHSFRWLLSILFLLALVLTACERPLQEPVEEEGTTTPLNPTPLGGGEPTIIITPPLASPTAMVEPGTEPGPQPTTEGEPAAGEPTATPAPSTEVRTEEVIYTVVAGDTLGNIADRYGVTVEALAARNNLADVHTLEVGQQLTVPVPGESEPAGEPVVEATATQPAATTEEQVHIVQPGDNLYRIGLRYGFTIEQLVAYNNLTNPDRLEVGQQIRIPPEGYTVNP